MGGYGAGFLLKKQGGYKSGVKRKVIENLLKTLDFMQISLDIIFIIWYNLSMEKQIENLTNEAKTEYILSLESELEKMASEIQEWQGEMERQASEARKRQEEIEKKDAEIERLGAKLEKAEKEYLRLHENFEKLRKMLFGRSSEKTRFIEDASQLSFLSRVFNEVEAFATQAGKEEASEIEVPGHTRKKKRSREELLEHLPVFEVLYDTDEADRVCGACGGDTRYLGKEHVRDEIEIVPAKMYINRISRVNYVCDSCHKDEDQARIIKSEVPEPVIKHSLASPSAAASVIYQKFINSMPLARQEKDWSYNGVNIGRATLGNWVLKASREHLFPLYDLMKESLLSAKIIAADETDIQVLKETDRQPQTKSKMWAYRTIGKVSSPPIILFEYQPGRLGAYAANFLRGFKGMLMTDAFTGYNAVEGVIHCYCWAHCRRHWYDALPKNPEGSKAKIGLDYCDELFRLERKWADLPPEERFEKRSIEAKPVLDAYFAWALSLDYLVGSKLGKAAEYSINHKTGLLAYLLEGEAEISNNRLEGMSIRKFVIGRKNFVAVDTVAGAKASAVCYSIVLTAWENGLNVYEYLKHLFQELPKRRKNKGSDILENCLPWSKSLPEKCYIHKPADNDNSEQLTLQ